MSRIIWSPQAVRDLELIRDYVAQDSEQYAALVIQRLLSSVERLVSFPLSGRVVPERDERDLREVITRPYRIVYRVRDGAVEIVTVFRASRLFSGW